MKKLIIATSLTLAAPLAAADFLGVYAGAGQWRADYSGDLGDPSISADELGLEDSANNVIYVAFEHPIPLIPNARIQHTDISSSQSSRITRSFTLDNQTFVAGENVDSDIDLTHTDFTLYYELLDNWVNLDLGVTLRRFDGYASAEGEAFSETVDIKETLPMVYGKAQFDLPFTGWSVGAEGNVVSYEDNQLTDLTAKVSYKFGVLAEFGFEAGYRILSMELDEDVYADMELKGPYAGLTFHF